MMISGEGTDDNRVETSMMVHMGKVIFKEEEASELVYSHHKAILEEV